MSEPRNQSKRATSASLREKYSQPYVLPETVVRDLALNLQVGQAHDAAMCLLIIEEAVRSIEIKTETRELNLRLIERIAAEEQCRPIQRMVDAIVAAIGNGVEGTYASCLTITRFLEFAFGYQPDRTIAERLYKIELGKISSSM